jgi:peptidoglycan hydrolase-like protein with peptidoglycan-binding domain
MVHSRLGSSIAAALMLSFAVVGFASALTATCTGTAGATNIMWSGAASGGTAPLAFLWGNGSTAASQTVDATQGTHSMTLQVTDASSTVATTTCSATVNQAGPTINSFVATPASITSGQSSVLSWTVTNASSTSINNSVGTVTGTSTSVSPTVTTIYTLSATNPGGTVTSNATVTVNATSTGGISAQIQALLNQINALKAQVLLLVQQRGGGDANASSTPKFPKGCGIFNRDLKHGDLGDDVKELQQTLAEDPSLLTSDSITGFFGPKTQAALMKFQRKFGINSTGFFGPLSRGFLKENCGKADSDQDGIRNSEDTDDDNDGTPDTEDSHPHNPNVATSTNMRAAEHGKKNDMGWKGKGNSGHATTTE